MEKKKRTLKFHYAYVILFCCCIFAATSVSLTFGCSGIFYTPVSESLGVSRGVFAIYSTIMSLVSAVAVHPVRKLYERIGIKKVTLLLLILQAFCFAIQSHFTKVWMFYITGVCYGFIISFIPTMVPTVALNNWFNGRVGFFMGFSSSMAGISGIILNPLAGRFMEMYGWEKTYILYAAIICFVAIPIALLLFRDKPSDMGLEPCSSNKNTVAQGQVSLAGVRYDAAVRSKAFVYTAIATVCIGSASTFVPYIPSYASSLGMTLTFAATLAGVVQIGALIGKNIIGAVSDRKPEKLAMIGTITPCIGIVIMYAGSKIMPVLMDIGAVCFGIVYSASVLIPLIVRSVFGMRDFIKIFSALNLIISVCNAISNSMWGFIADLMGGSFNVCIIICLLLMIIGCATGKMAFIEGRKLKHEVRMTTM